ncbi:GNAT family N-acetyltransferase [Rhizobium sp. CSW-27]|nr:GNAT family N-acetyltransferase [Rhizobium sp. CSW-27]MBT9370493.1 GNAT family N-acetyltransferase [Rhizobium sp. CSW-27]
MAAADHRAVAAVGFAAWQSSDAFRESGLPLDRLEQVRLAYERFPAEATDKITVAEFDGRIAGWTARETEPDYISDLWVDPTRQGKGIGRALVEHLLSVMRREGLERARIHTHGSNAGAIRLYERCGFSIVWRGLEYSTSLGMEHEKVHLEMRLKPDPDVNASTV